MEFIKQESDSQSQSPPSSPTDDIEDDVERSLLQLHQHHQQQDLDNDLPLDMKLKELESKQNLRLYLMKSWNVMQGAGNVPELSNSEIRKLLMSPPQSPSINSTSKDAVATSVGAPSATTTTAADSIEDQLDSTNDSDTLVMALEEDHVNCSGGNNAVNRSAAGAEKDVITTTLRTLKSPLNDGMFTYWAVVKTQSTGSAASSTSPSATATRTSAGPGNPNNNNNYLSKFHQNRYLSILFPILLTINPGDGAIPLVRVKVTQLTTAVHVIWHIPRRNLLKEIPVRR